MEKRLAFGCGRALALSRILLFALGFGAVGAFLVLFPAASLLPIALLAAVLAVGAVLFAVSPLLTQHWLTRSRLILRQGWYFRAILPLAEIESASASEETKAAQVPLGIHRPLGRPVLFVTAGRSGLIVLRLARPRRFWQAFGLAAEEIVFDVTDPTGFLAGLEERLSLLPPVEADRAHADLRD